MTTLASSITYVQIYVADGIRCQDEKQTFVIQIWTEQVLYISFYTETKKYARHVIPIIHIDNDTKAEFTWSTYGSVSTLPTTHL